MLDHDGSKKGVTRHGAIVIPYISNNIGIIVIIIIYTFSVMVIVVIILRCHKVI